MPSTLRLFQSLAANERWMRRLGRWMGDWNPWLPESRRDSYPAYARLREGGSPLRSPLLGAWLVSRYDDAERVLRDRELFSTDRKSLPVIRLARRSLRREPDLLAFLDDDLLMLDGERHTRLRRLVSRAFTPRRVEGLRSRVESLVEELLDRVEARGDGCLEVVRDLAGPLPAIVIGEMLGVPAEDWPRLRIWSHEMAELLDPLSGRDGLEPPKRASRALADYFRGLLEARRREPRDDLLSAMAAAREGTDQLSESEILSLAMLVLVAGHETTTNLIGNGVLCLLRHPDERKRLQEDPGLWPSAIEELLRFESPIQLTDRVATRSCELSGARVRKGQLVAVLLGSANRDPARFESPERLDFSRPDNQHLAFGHGAHFCLGAQLARLEGKAALAGLLRRFPDFRGPLEPEGWKRSVVLRGPTALAIETGLRG